MCYLVWKYMQELSRQLTVIEPEAPRYTLDGKTPWPPMKLSGFRVDFGNELAKLIVSQPNRFL